MFCLRSLRGAPEVAGHTSLYDCPPAKNGGSSWWMRHVRDESGHRKYMMNEK
jgi:hypothetical protein